MAQSWCLLAPLTPMHPGRSLPKCPLPQRVSAWPPPSPAGRWRIAIETGACHECGCLRWCCRCRRRPRCFMRAAGAAAGAELPMLLSAWLCCFHCCGGACWPGLFSATLADMACGRACMVAALTGPVRRLVSLMLCLPQSRSVS